METTKRSTFKVLFYLKKNAPKKNGNVPIMCRITVNGKQSTFSTKLDIPSSNWDLKYNRVLGKSRTAQKLNTKLNKIRFGIEESHSNLLKMFIVEEKQGAPVFLINGKFFGHQAII